jgi:DNA-directed RNA polymerase specialized sigma54-like protein
MTDLQKHGQELLAEAIAKLWEAMIELTRPTSPQTPLPRAPAKPIKIARGVELRVEVRHGCVNVYVFAQGTCLKKINVSDGKSLDIYPSLTAKEMMPYLSQPRALANCLRQLRWLTAWMRKRAEGRRRAAEEILRQQRKWIEMLEGEIAMRGLAK